MYKSGFLILNFYRELARKMNLELQEVLNLTHEEITSFPEKMPLVEDIKERVKEFGSISVDGKRIIMQGKVLEDYKQKLEKEEYNVDEIKGSPAFIGKVTGPARIVRNKTMLHKVQAGDVLVAVMTFPDFVPAMEKAVAFVTNEGGILCHAAIVSREMQKPCVVGTSIATKVFKDGEMIEVDAEKGIVRRLK
jgi:pyruvate,water dikinase